MSLRVLLKAVVNRMEHAFERAGGRASAADDAARGEFTNHLISERGVVHGQAEPRRRRGPRLG